MGDAGLATVTPALVEGLAAKAHASRRSSSDFHDYSRATPFGNEDAVGPGPHRVDAIRPVWAQRALGDRTFTFFGEHMR